MASIRRVASRVVASIASLAIAATLSGFVAPGTLDTSFGNGGTVVTASGDDLVGLALRSDGRIVAGGGHLLARYLADGTLDPAFGAGGRVQPQGSGRITALALQSDGSVVTAETDLVRYRPDGSVDPSFNASLSISSCSALALQPDGRIIAVGSVYTNGNSDFALVRYNRDGTFDTTFGAGGMVRTDLRSSGDVAHAVALGSDGRIVVAGWTSVGNRVEIAVVRYLPDGRLDPAFGAGGIATTAIGPANADARTVLIQPDGRIVVAGQAAGNADGTNLNFAVARYTPQGTLDATFGNGGTVVVDVGAGAPDGAQALVIRVGGRIVAAGDTCDTSPCRFALVRLDPDGTLDATFGNGGIVTTVIGRQAHATSALVEPDGQIVAGGFAFDGSADEFALARYWGSVCGNGVLEGGEDCDGRATCAAGARCTGFCACDASSSTTTLPPPPSTSSTTATSTTAAPPTTVVTTSTSTTTTTIRSATFTCTEILGFSQSLMWHETPEFQQQIDDARWQMRFRSGGDVDLWADPNADAWSPPVRAQCLGSGNVVLCTPCAQNSNAPDRVVFTITLQAYESDVQVWAQKIRAAIATIHQKHPQVRQIVLQPVVGGPMGGGCPYPGQPLGVRAAFNHPFIDQAIADVVHDSPDLVAGISPEVRSCADYSDNIGHLTPAARGPAGSQIGQYYALRP
jgi:uncharacterized delta-60 repeat protein